MTKEMWIRLRHNNQCAFHFLTQVVSQTGLRWVITAVFVHQDTVDVEGRRSRPPPVTGPRSVQADMSSVVRLVAAVISG